MDIAEILKDEKKIMSIAEITFKRVDTDGNGSISKIELGEALRSMLGKEFASQKEVDQVFDELDTDKNGTISLDEFQLLIKNVLYSMMEDQSPAKK
jgi:Ca2+-binding EF-hand superfamily protein